MEIKDGDIYPKYSFRLSQADKDWLDHELDALKAKFNAGGDGSFPVVTKNVLMMSALKRGLRFLRDDVNARCIQKNLEVTADPSRVWTAITDQLTFDPHVGGKFSTQTATGVVTAVAPNEFIQFTWKERTWSDSEETVCWFRLRPGAECGTRVELVHSGWEVFPGARATALKEEFEARWDTLLGQLASPLTEAF